MSRGGTAPGSMSSSQVCCASKNSVTSLVEDWGARFPKRTEKITEAEYRRVEVYQLYILFSVKERRKAVTTHLGTCQKIE